jgi:hypothetical protein
MIRPPLHETFPQLTDYRLMDQPERHGDPVVRKLVAVWKKHVSYAYSGDQVDWQIGEDCYLLTAETADVLYGPGPWDELGYQPGSRPMLEAALREQIKIGHLTGDRHKAVAIMRFARDIRNSMPEKHDLFHGGSEEEVIKKGSGMCNEQSRVMIRLAQIAGLPARYVGHISADHGCAEIRIDGRWSYFDIRGHHYNADDGHVASIWELKCHPGLIERQDPQAAADILPGRTRAMTRTQTHPRAITVIAPYRFADYTWADYAWTHNTADLRRRLAGHEKTWHAVLAELHQGADFTRAG